MPEDRSRTAVLEPPLSDLDMQPEEVYRLKLPVVERVYRGVQPVNCIFKHHKCGDSDRPCGRGYDPCPRDNY
jgi:hypothetical protein